MRLDRFFARNRVLDLESTDLQGCLEELIDASVARFKDLDRSKVLTGVLQRESTMTTYLGNGVALPHVRLRMRQRYIIAVGRSREGIRYDGVMANEKVHLILLLLAGDKARDYLQVLASVARVVKEKAFIDSLIEAPDIHILYDRLTAGFGGVLEKPQQKPQSKTNRLIFREAAKIARGAGCSAVAIFADVMENPTGFAAWFPGFKTILVTRALKDGESESRAYSATIQVRSFSKARLAQLRSAVLVGITRGTIQFGEKICCVGGIPGSERFDTIVVVDLQAEFQTLLAEHLEFLPPDVNPEVFERVIAIAMELAVEGREGRPVGCLFVLGDTSKVEKMTKPLVINPFHGYGDEDRNILNPFMDETVKEFSLLDGGFIIKGDGVITSAGALIHAPDYYHELPSGLGARHAAAAAISIATQCLSIVVSSSTGQVTVFRRGVALPLIEKDFSGFA
ncbi:MAG: hypothetical protein EA425_08015 [Puniceicoccaceae bacterium]|nr:MAG: hypothetical protein EA425_08015 [Puniceicoccaceae bacterium]